MIEALSLALACPGSFDIRESEVTPHVSYHPDGQASYSYSNSVTRRQKAGFVRLVIEDGTARLHGYWNDKDWNAVENLTIDDEKITGDARVKKNKLRSFVIDRATGHIKIGVFSGQCEAHDPAQRKF